MAVDTLASGFVYTSVSLDASQAAQIKSILFQSLRGESDAVVQMVAIHFVASTEQMVGVARIVSITPVDIGNTREECNNCLLRSVPDGYIALIATDRCLLQLMLQIVEPGRNYEAAEGHDLGRE